MKNKKTISILLSAALCLSTAPLAMAYEGEEAEENAYPISFDLREYGVVTPVKFQNPWGSCWAFGGIAAAESSILTTMGMTAEEFKAEYGEDFNLSEKHLVWYALHPVTADTDDGQAGEGMYVFDGETDPNAAFDAGGKGIYITTLFSSGVGPVFEENFPYRGAEGTTELEFSQTDPEGAKNALKEHKEEELEMTLEDAVAQIKEDPAKAEEWFGYLYKENYLDSKIPAAELTADQIVEAMYQRDLKNLQTKNYYTSHDDWTIPDVAEDGHTNRDLYAGFTLMDGNQLPNPAIKDESEKWVDINDAGIRAIKSELMQGRGVTIAFHADKSKPGEDVSKEGFLNLKTWAHYTDVDADINHGVCIIGWDDSYSKDNFTEGHQPPADGAWIVKNSWGSETEYKEGPNGMNIGYSDWGIVDGQGKHTGYFYISYYDKSVTNPESMVFGMDMAEEGGMGVWMYDYMPSILDQALKIQSESVLKTANVFTNDSGKAVKLRSVSTKTANQRTRVVFSIYLLGENAANPEDGELLDKKVAYYEYSGFHRLPLNDDIRIEDGEKIAIVAEESAVGVDGTKLYEYAVNSGFTKQTAEAFGQMPTYSIGVVNKGESYLYENGKWTDWADYEMPFDGDMKQEMSALGIEGDDAGFKDLFTVDNFSIKAYVVDADGSASGIFDDVEPGDWFADAVDYVYGNGLMIGVSENMFAPNGDTTREQCMTCVARLCGDETYTVDEGVDWAVSHQLSDGTDRGSTLSREQFAVMLYRSAEVLGMDTGYKAEPTGFGDWSSVSDWAQGAISWAVDYGIINGMDNNTLSPQGNVTRGQLAAMLQRFGGIMK